jgi:hypothetical protein
MPQSRADELPSGTLYHYTSVAGMLGIIATWRLWATHIGYVNDAGPKKAGRSHQLICPRAIVCEQRVLGGCR